MKSWLARLLSKSLSEECCPLDTDRIAELPFACEHSSGVAVPNREKILQQLQATCQRQLRLLHQVLVLNSAVMLWSGPQTEQLSIYAAASSFDSLQLGPFPYGYGITGVLKRQDQLKLAPVTAQSPAIPYYNNQENVGSVLAVKLMIAATSDCQRDGAGVLCVDRSSSEPWSDADVELVNETAAQLTAAVSVARQLFVSDRERHAYRRACDGMKKLNAALGLESTFAAAADAVTTIVPADFFAISLVEEAGQRVCFAQGEQAESLSGQVFPVEQGLVGKVVKYARTLPDNADYQGGSPVFSPAHLFADYRSLTIVPLRRDEGPANGAMVVAAKQPQMFSRTCREMLELVATQVAVKIELAKSHEKLNRMATVDGLTGIANRRAFQLGLGSMLSRADRHGAPLTLILCDIDLFKQINDRFGHPFGDEVLQQVAKLFACVVRSNDLAARIGGEEFAVLLENTDHEGAWKVAERLRQLVEGLQLRCANTAAPVSISLGIAVYPEDATLKERLVDCADQALYRAKAAGRNCTIAYSQAKASKPLAKSSASVSTTGQC